MSTNNSFFNESKEQSKVKSVIVSKYFSAWSKVIIAAQNKSKLNTNKKIAYIDLFAGPGRYKDETKSTPILVLEMAIKNEELQERLITIFNDKDKSNTKSLESEINRLAGIEKLKFKPQIDSNEVGDKIVKMFEEMTLIPVLFFVDPWGYKGLSLRLINSVLKDWGSDCIFFFNYNRINMGLSNPLVKEHMNALFGEERANSIKTKLELFAIREREMFIIEELCAALKELGAKYVLPFRFKDDGGRRTSHHLIFLSKDFKGYEIMKEIMAKSCSKSDQGVPSFEYNPVHKKFKFLFELSRPLDDLKENLLKDFEGQQLTMKTIYRRHCIDRPYIKKNYKSVLAKLEEDKRISTSKHRKNSFGDDVVVTFPEIIESEKKHGN